MKVPRTRIADVLAKRSMSQGFGRAQALPIAAYLLEEGRIGELDSLLRDVSVDWAKYGYLEVKAFSAHKLSDSAASQIKDMVRGLYPEIETIHLTEILNPGLIGGIRLEFDNRQLDTSVQSELNKFKMIAVNGKD